MVDFDDKLEHLSEQDIAFIEAGGSVRNVRVMVYERAQAAALTPRTPARRRRTMGGLPAGAQEAWVYVATNAADQVKIGMTSNLARRMAELSADLRLALPLVPASAKHVEADAFHMLGHDLADGEWLAVDVGRAMGAVWQAYTRAAMRMPVIAGLSEKDARQMRIALAAL